VNIPSKRRIYELRKNLLVSKLYKMVYKTLEVFKSGLVDLYSRPSKNYKKKKELMDAENDVE
jgi:hypothetical protein